MVMKKLYSFVLAALLLPGLVVADTVTLKPDHPDRYVVQKGDTLWDISSRFLSEPWLWPEIWQVNPQIENPHLIFPGDVVVLRYVDGRPVVTVERREAEPEPEDGVVKLSPGVRVSDIETAVPTIPIDIIQQFLQRPRVLSEEQIDAAPYVVSVGREALIGKPGRNIYARGVNGEDTLRYTVYRKGQEYVDPERDNEVLGFEAIHIADVLLQDSGDPATLLVTSAKRELLKGDRLFPVLDEEIDTTFMPRAPDREVSGLVIAVVDGVSQIGQFQVVVLNLGRDNGMEKGHVMSVWQRGETIRDPYAGVQNATVTLPDEQAGTVMVFRVFDRVSYALVMEATRAMHVHDRVKNP